MRLIEFELLKLLKNKKMIFIVLSCFLFSILFVAYNHYQHNRYIEDMIQSLQSDNAIANQKVEYLNKLKVLDESHKELLEYWGKEAVTTSYLKIYYSSPKLFEWEDILKQTNNRNLNLIVGYQKEYISIYTQSTESRIKDLENEIILNNYLLEQHIETLLSPYYPSASNSIYLLNTKEVMLIMMILFVVSIVDIFSGEIESGAYKLTYTSPYSRIQIIQAKILVSSIFVSLLYIIVPVFVFIISRFITGYGCLQYPILVNTLGYFQVIPVVKFIQLSFIYYWLFLIFFVFLCSLVFIAFKESTSIISVFSGLFLIVFLLSSSRSQSIINYLPLGSFDLITILQFYGFNMLPLFFTLTIVYSGIVYVLDRILIKQISFTGGK